ncbi:cystatin-like [Heteronotia binoei]|uniref:cystatin-like n=1 Tax=Heteronotia binoei TaxID=13085 RepID=UPI00292E14A3|nr:cystatin-like [Heteronotia binoei]
MWAGLLSLLSQPRGGSLSFPAMASTSYSLVSVALRSLLLCMLVLLPVFMADHGRMLVGGWRDRLISEPDVQEAVEVAIDHYNRVCNSIHYCVAQEVIKAQSQVVEGIKYYLKILVLNTQCDKRKQPGLTYKDLEACRPPPRDEQQRKLCKFYVWSRSWLNDTHVTSMSCGRANS